MVNIVEFAFKITSQCLSLGIVDNFTCCYNCSSYYEQFAMQTKFLGPKRRAKSVRPQARALTYYKYFTQRRDLVCHYYPNTKGQRLPWLSVEFSQFDRLFIEFITHSKVYVRHDYPGSSELGVQSHIIDVYGLSPRGFFLKCSEIGCLPTSYTSSPDLPDLSKEPISTEWFLAPGRKRCKMWSHHHKYVGVLMDGDEYNFMVYEKRMVINLNGSKVKYKDLPQYKCNCVIMSKLSLPHRLALSKAAREYEREQEAIKKAIEEEKRMAEIRALALELAKELIPHLGGPQPGPATG